MNKKNIWTDHWLPGVQNLGDFVNRELNGNEHSQLLANFVTRDNNWDWVKLSTILPNDCLELLVPLKAPDPLVGRMYWLGFQLLMESSL